MSSKQGPRRQRARVQLYTREMGQGRFGYAPKRRVDLPPGLIFDIARRAGITVPTSGDRRTIACPFHDDRHPSAFLSARNVFFCHVCTPGRGLSAKQFSKLVRLPWNPPQGGGRPLRGTVNVQGRHSFGPQEASKVWGLARRAEPRSGPVSWDDPARRFLDGRNLGPAWELGLMGILEETGDLPPAVRRWPSSGHRLIVPLFDGAGIMSNIQGRAVRENRLKVRCPKGSLLKGSLFANVKGLALLRGCESGGEQILFGEGLTDYLALSIHSDMPVLSCPGAGNAVSGLGAWVEGARLLIAFDADEPGDAAAELSAKRAYELGAEEVLRVRWPGEPKDACDALKAMGPGQFQALLGEMSR